MRERIEKREKRRFREEPEEKEDRLRYPVNIKLLVEYFLHQSIFSLLYGGSGGRWCSRGMNFHNNISQILQSEPSQYKTTC